VIVGLHHVQLAVPAGVEPALRAFYGGVLGMTEVAKPAELAARGGVWFRSGTAELHLGVAADFRPARKAHPGLLVDDLGAIAAQLAAAGHTVRADDLLPGFRRCYVEDPCGNRLELLAAAGPLRQPGLLAAG
jgi:catechol 2,3-dioxygenase-like lactoylglutathione lyase family enzyme